MEPQMLSANPFQCLCEDVPFAKIWMKDAKWRHVDTSGSTPVDTLSWYDRNFLPLDIQAFIPKALTNGM
jgi:hypothetical protein